jgi:hypothetical protein
MTHQHDNTSLTHYLQALPDLLLLQNIFTNNLEGSSYRPSLLPTIISSHESEFTKLGYLVNNISMPTTYTLSLTYIEYASYHIYFAQRIVKAGLHIALIELLNTMAH